MEFVQQMALVGAVLVLLASALWVLRRRGFAAVMRVRKRERRLECLERLSLGPQHTLHLVRVDEGAWLLASTPGGCSLVPSQMDRGTAGLREAVR